ncbi:SGNH/GDSL hydrolase family protein [Magnetovibrio sp.]|uniref:SGNH/GDSL hydrolase family protein n=1 Tax=Magnetovibrio sp. TaxID=2024836 RepID=UPI002F91F4E5
MLTKHAGVKWRDRLINASLTLVSCVSVIAAVEFALDRDWIPGQRPVQTTQLGDASSAQDLKQRAIRLRMQPPLEHRVYSPNEDYLKNRSDSLAAGEYVMDTDGFGFIRPGLEHLNADLTLAFLGGSTTENFFMKPAQRFHYGTAQLLEQRTGHTVNAINAARSGNVTLHSVNIFLNAVLEHHPDVAILMHNINDYAVLYHEKSYWNDHPERSLVYELPHSGTFLPSSLSVSQAARQLLDTAMVSLIPNLTARLNLVSANLMGGSAQSTVFGEDAQRRRWGVAKALDMVQIEHDFRSALTTFVSAARSWQIEPVLMTQPHRWPERLDEHTPASIRDFMARKAITGIDYGEFRAGYVRLNDVIRETARDLNVPLIDLQAEIAPNTENLFDAIHLTGTGSQIASTVIAETLMKYFDFSQFPQSPLKPKDHLK